jgi:hypothetical protein
MKQDNNEQNIIRAIFKSEIVWILSIGSALWGFVATVVMPIQALQLGQQQIQAQLAHDSARYIDSDERINTLEKNQAVVMNKLQLKSNVE